MLNFQQTISCYFYVNEVPVVLQAVLIYHPTTVALMNYLMTFHRAVRSLQFDSYIHSIAVSHTYVLVVVSIFA